MRPQHLAQLVAKLELLVGPLRLKPGPPPLKLLKDFSLLSGRFFLDLALGLFLGGKRLERFGAGVIDPGRGAILATWVWRSPFATRRRHGGGRLPERRRGPILGRIAQEIVDAPAPLRRL